LRRPLLLTFLAVVAVSLVAPLVWARVLRILAERCVDPAAAFVANEIFFWDLGLAVISVVRYVEGENLAGLEFHRLSARQAALGAAFAAGMCLTMALLWDVETRMLHLASRTMADVTTVAQWPLWARLITSLRAGFVEEVIFRAYPITRSDRIVGCRWPGALAGLVAFTLSHIPYAGAAHALGVVLPLGAMLTLLFLWQRNLTLNIGVHCLCDVLVSSGLPLLIVGGR
jgi:membrane protease YdiL (CAAX protease family)